MTTLEKVELAVRRSKDKFEDPSIEIAFKILAEELFKLSEEDTKE